MTTPTTMSGGEAMVRATLANGVSTIFGIPGVQTYTIYDAIVRLGVQSIVPRHEQAAAYMALGYARATGKPGVFSVVPGPGVLNASAALLTAMGTNAPVLCLTGQVPSAFLGVGRGHLHEMVDQAGTLKSIIKDAWRVDDPRDASAVINNAFRVMQSGRPGPVSVEMCWDTLDKPRDGVVVGPGNTRIDKPALDQEQLDRAVKALASARFPMIMCGGGAQHASAEVLALAEALQAPVTALRSGRGVVAEDHALGVSSVAARELFDNVDVLVGVGSRLEMIYLRWRNMGLYERKPKGGPLLIRIDIDPREMIRFEPDIAIVGDSAAACRALAEALAGSHKADAARSTAIAAAKALALRETQKIQPQIAYLDAIRAVLPRDGFFVPEVSQMGFASYASFPVYTPRTFVTEGYQGTLGYGFMTALGVKVACPDRAVVSITGDGGFMFGVQELATAAAYGIGLVTVLFNNHSFGNVRRDQFERFEGRISGGDLQNPDFMKLAEAFGVAGVRVTTPQALRVELARAIEAGKPALIEVEQPRGVETSAWPWILMGKKPWV
ncbi:MAG: thiamine pyrophosphate-dependent enzyme [Pseudomonadota bacterium]